MPHNIILLYILSSYYIYHKFSNFIYIVLIICQERIFTIEKSCLTKYYP